MLLLCETSWTGEKKSPKRFEISWFTRGKYDSTLSEAPYFYWVLWMLHKFGIKKTFKKQFTKTLQDGNLLEKFKWLRLSYILGDMIYLRQETDFNLIKPTNFANWNTFFLPQNGNRMFLIHFLRRGKNCDNETKLSVKFQAKRKRVCLAAAIHFVEDCQWNLEIELIIEQELEAYRIIEIDKFYQDFEWIWAFSFNIYMIYLWMPIKCYNKRQCKSICNWTLTLNQLITTVHHACK